MVVFNQKELKVGGRQKNQSYVRKSSSIAVLQAFSLFLKLTSFQPYASYVANETLIGNNSENSGTKAQKGNIAKEQKWKRKKRREEKKCKRRKCLMDSARETTQNLIIVATVDQ